MAVTVHVSCYSLIHNCIQKFQLCNLFQIIIDICFRQARERDQRQRQIREKA